MKKPLISVVIPVFNGAAFLEEAVRSVLKNSYRSFEILLIDDGSSDNSKALCRKLARRHANRIRFFPFEKNKGLGRVLNFALAKAKGRYIARLNQDDRMLPHRLSTQVRFMEAHTEIVACGSWIRYFDPKGNTQILTFMPDDATIRKSWLFVSAFSDPSTMYRKSAALQVGGYDQSLWPCDDTHLWYRMGTIGKLANIQKPLVEVRWHDGAGSVKFFRTMVVKTFRMHLWLDQYIQKAPWYVHLFWICEYFAGMTLSPQMNWQIYRVVKRLMRGIYEANVLLTNTYQNIQKVLAARTHPKKLSFSGA